MINTYDCQLNMYHKIFRLLDKDYVITSTNGKEEIEIGYSTLEITRIRIDTI